VFDRIIFILYSFLFRQTRTQYVGSQVPRCVLVPFSGGWIKVEN
jgi:hypothetical protein